MTFIVITLSITTLSKMILSVTVLIKNKLNVVTFSMTMNVKNTLNINTLSIVALNIIKLSNIMDLVEANRIKNNKPWNTKGGSITVPLTSCLTGLD
jgi:hypothetical protein